MPALKPATIGQKLLTDCGQNRPLTTTNEGDEHIAALAASSSFEEVFLETRAFTEFTWWEGDVEEDLIEDWLSLGD